MSMREIFRFLDSTSSHVILVRKMKTPPPTSRRLRPAFGWMVLCWTLLGLAGHGSATELLSKRSNSLASSVGGNDSSAFPLLSADGRFVVFFSSANNLVAGDNSLFYLDVFLHDRASNTTVLVSANYAGTGGGNESSVPFQISTNGRFVLFQSDASDLLPGDTNGVTDIFVRDVQTASNILVSIATNGGWANAASTEAVMTPDGRYVAFVSAATNLVAGDTNGIADVFLRDLVAQTTTLVTTGAFGAGSFMAEPVITPDGHVIAFSSSANGLAAGVPTASKGEIYAFNALTGTMTWVSTNALLTVSNILRLNNMPSYHPALSDDGTIVAYKAGWTNGATAPAAPGLAQAIVFRYDFAVGSNSVIATNAFPRWPFGDDTYGPSLSSDGRFIAYTITNKSPVSSTSIQLWDTQLATNVAVSVNQSGGLPTNSYSDGAVLNPGGQFVLFLSSATNLTGNVVSNGTHIYLRDLQAAVTTLVDVDTNGVGSVDSNGNTPTLSADGRFVAFDTQLSDIKNPPGNVFVRDLANGTNELVSLHLPGLISQTGDNSSWISKSSMSDDGRWLAFTTYADDLVANDTNNALDVFVADRVAGTNVLVSAGTDGNPARGGFSTNPAISGNGRFVAFISTATNLVGNVPTNYFNNLFVRDLQAGTNRLVTISTNGLIPGDGDTSDAVISSDGRYVAFLSKARNLAAGLTGTGPNTFWCDLNSGVIVSPAGTSISDFAPTMSANGRYLAYFRTTAQLCVWNSQAKTNIYTNTSIVASAVLSPTGTQLVYQVSKKIFVYDFASRTNVFSILSAPLINSSSQWSTNGRYLAFTTATNAAVGDTNGVNDIYLCDLSTGTLTLVSLNSGRTGSANGSSDSPAISGDGRFVVYRSAATDIAGGIANPSPNIFLYDRLTGSNTLISVGSSSLPSWSSWMSRPAINTDGRAVAFGSWAAGLVAGDLNRVQDVFAGLLTPLVLADSDGDGIPDDWMLKYFGHATGQAGDSSRAQDDADGDGLTNLQEYLTGTNPTDPASVFKLQIAPTISTNSVALTWIAVPGASYQIQYRDNLTDLTWLSLPGNVAVTGSQGYFIMPANQPSRFYRITEVN